MKKKGLIISTIVMVVVLIAALTTSTYAWFNSSAATSVEQITLTTEAAEGLLIGVHSSNASTSSSVFQEYTSGTLTWGLSQGSHYNGTWTGGDSGFGLTIDCDAINTWNSNYAVGYTTTALANAASNPSVEIPENSWFMAQGNGSTRSNMDVATIQFANANQHFVVLDLGVTASQNNLVKQAWVSITVTTTTGDYTNPGMAAAVTIGYCVNKESTSAAVAYSDLTWVDAFYGMTQANGYDHTACTKGALDTTANSWTFSLELYNEATAMQKNADIGRVYLVLYLNGDDDACIISNLGTGATINIDFGYDEDQNTFTFTNGIKAEANP